MFKIWIQFYEHLGVGKQLAYLKHFESLPSHLYWNGVGKCGDKIKVEETFGERSKLLLYWENPTGNEKVKIWHIQSLRKPAGKWQTLCPFFNMIVLPNQSAALLQLKLLFSFIISFLYVFINCC